MLTAHLISIFSCSFTKIETHSVPIEFKVDEINEMHHSNKHPVPPHKTVSVDCIVLETEQNASEKSSMLAVESAEKGTF